MLPFAAQPLAHCSATRIRSRVGFGSRSKLPDAEVRAAVTRFEEQPVRDRRRPCRLRHIQRPAENADRFRRDARRLRRVRASRRCTCRQSDCASQKPPTLLRGVTCHVTRPLAFSNVRSEYSGRLKSGA